MFDRLYFTSWLSLGTISLLVGGCADDVAVTVTESSGGTTQSSTSGSTTGTPNTPTTSGDPTTSTSGGSTSTGVVTDTDTDALTSGTSTGSTEEPNTGTTGSTGEPDTSSTGEPDTSSSSGGDTDTGGECVPGQLNCECDANDLCAGETACVLGKCIPYTGQCEFELNFECDEGTLCEVGTDPFDCCPNQQDGICEEVGMGGDCPVYSDYFDCGYCVFTNNNFCEEPQYCPVGTDEADCCATPEDGVCEEMSMGGSCPDGSDPYDCGFCEFQNDGFCDEPDFCAPGSDSADCCSTPQNGVCEEMSMGGECEDGSDHFDCGYCIDENDGFCDEPDFCPAGTDTMDCCATSQDGVCEEMQFGGQCMDGSDHFDCGYCIDENDGICDEPGFCPEGTDEVDCCITNDDGICDELALGGTCAEGVDFYDCGYCPFEDDAECDVPFICPEGTDVNDCG